jgi:excisionase family DNA binding protein
MTKLSEVPSGFVSTKQAAKLAGYTSDYIGQIAREGRIESVKIGRERFVKVEDVFEYVRTRNQEEEEKQTVAAQPLTTPIAPQPEEKTVKLHPVSVEDVQTDQKTDKEPVKTNLNDEDLIRISRQHSTRLTPIIATNSPLNYSNGDDNLPKLKKGNREVFIDSSKVELLPSPYSIDRLLLGASKAAVGVAAIVAIFASGLNFIVQMDALAPKQIRPAAIAAYQITEVTRQVVDLPDERSTNQLATPISTESSFIDYVAMSFYNFVESIIK